MFFVFNGFVFARAFLDALVKNISRGRERREERRKKRTTTRSDYYTTFLIMYTFSFDGNNK